jgi:hypothetical protein
MVTVWVMVRHFLLALALLTLAAASPAVAQQETPPALVPDQTEPLPLSSAQTPLDTPATPEALRPPQPIPLDSAPPAPVPLDSAITDGQTEPALPAPDAAGPAPAGAPSEPPVPTGKQRLKLSALFNETGPVIRSGVNWRVFRVQTDESGQMPIVAESKENTPVFDLEPGVYVVHAAYGLAGATQRVDLSAGKVTETLALNAGALRVAATVDGKPIPATELTSRIQAILPNGDRRLIQEDVPAVEITRLPEGRYFVECVYGGLNAVVSGEIEIKAGQVSNASFRHRAASVTLKLVGQAGGEALANTSWSVLTPGGDVIREEIGAFPSMVLAEGQYTVVARHEGRVYQREFEVEIGANQEVEVLAVAAN